jgi:UDP-N-acetylglucosamine 2-epimerase
MSDIFFKELNIPIPDYNLSIGSGTPGYQVGHGIYEIEKVLIKEKPDLVVVFGDTNGTLSGALASNKLNIPLCHIEAGLRSFDKLMPEETNRVLTDHISDYLFCPSQVSYQNLAKEHLIKPDKVIISGDVMLDVLLKITKNIDEVSVFNRLISICETVLKGKSVVVNKYEYALTTMHRAENTDNIDRFKNIIESLIELSNDIPIIFPIHPRTRKVLDSLKLNIPENLIIIDPVGYKEILVLEKSAKLIITDSGGIQKEAYFFKKPSIILRDRTEWTEIVDCGYAELVCENELIIKEEDLKYQTYRSPVYCNLNRNDNAISICHLPSGLTSSSDTESVLRANIEIAVKKLKEKLLENNYGTTLKGQIINKTKNLLKKDFSSKNWDTFYGNGHSTDNIIKYLIGE